MEAEMLKSLKSQLQEALKVNEAERDRLERALALLTDQLAAKPLLKLPRSLSFAHLGVTEAARRFLAEKGRSGGTTREIVEALKERGVTTRSADFSNVVYASLAHCRDIYRKDFRWHLKSTR